jgi:diacylglycerol kinase family enzyme
VAVPKRATLLQLPTLVPRVLSTRARTVLRHRRVKGLPGLQTFHVDAVDERPFPLQVDGDYIGEFESVRYGVVPGGLLAVA